MIKVYFESDTHSELVATFVDEELYLQCFDTLEAVAQEHRMKVTESLCS